MFRCLLQEKRTRTTINACFSFLFNIPARDAPSGGRKRSAHAALPARDRKTQASHLKTGTRSVVSVPLLAAHLREWRSQVEANKFGEHPPESLPIGRTKHARRSLLFVFYCKTRSTGKIYWGLSPTPGRFFKTGFVLTALNIPLFLISDVCFTDITGDIGPFDSMIFAVGDQLYL